jgi:O-antigen/teichoic acid export membrane protein
MRAASWHTARIARVTARRRSIASLDAIAGVARLARASTGFRASSILLGGVVATVFGSYAYNLVCIRWLGSQDYGEVAALTAIVTILLLPLLGVQAALAREAAAFAAKEDASANAALLRLTLRRTTLWSVIGTGLLLLLSPLIARALNLDATTSAVVAAFVAGTGFAMPILQGILQGLNRFRRITVALIVYGLGRPLLAMPLVLAGLGVTGALSANAIASILATGIILFGVRDLLALPSHEEVELELEGFAPVIVGLLGFTVLMNADVIAAKVFLSGTEAGTYAAASLVGKLAALLPAGAIAPVLLPRATGRIERGEDPRNLVIASLIAATAFGVVLTVAMLFVPTSLVEWAFGEQFADARDLLAPCSAVMTLLGIINVNLTFGFALRDRVLVVLLCGAVVLDALLLALLHDSPYQILAATAIASAAVIVAHELFSPAAVWRLKRPLAA